MASYVIGRVLVVFDVMFFNMGQFICEHMKVVAKNFREIDIENFEGNFEIIMHKHREILKFSEDYNEFFKIIVVQKYCTAAASICVVGFTVIMVSVRRFPNQFFTDSPFTD